MVLDAVGNPQTILAATSTTLYRTTDGGDLWAQAVTGLPSNAIVGSLQIVGVAAMMGLLPIMWSMGTGADMMKRIAAPMIGGLVTSFILELLVYPPIYAIWKWNFEMKRGTVDVSALPISEIREH